MRRIIPALLILSLLASTADAGPLKKAGAKARAGLGKLRAVAAKVLPPWRDG